MKQQIQRIRSDLRELRKLTHAIDALMSLKKSREERRAYLVSIGTPEAISEIKRIDVVLKSLNLEEIISRSSELELHYVSAVNCLDSTEKTIIIDGYINGVAFWKIGRQLGYSEDTIKKKAKVALEHLAKYV